MIDLLNRLFMPDGFYEVVYNQIYQIICQGHFGDEDPSCFEIASDMILHYNPDPWDENRAEFKGSRITFYNAVGRSAEDNRKKTVESNIEERILSRLLEENILKEIRKEYKEELLGLDNSLLTGTRLRTLLKAKIQNLDYFLLEFPKRAWKDKIPFVGPEIERIRENFVERYGKSLLDSQSPASSGTPILKWQGSLPELCKLFYFNSRDNHNEHNIKCFWDASKEELVNFIFNHIRKEDGKHYDRNHIMSIFLPFKDNPRMTSTHRKNLNQLQKLVLPPNSQGEE